MGNGFTPSSAWPVHPGDLFLQKQMIPNLSHLKSQSFILLRNLKFGQGFLAGSLSLLHEESSGVIPLVVSHGLHYVSKPTQPPGSKWRTKALTAVTKSPSWAPGQKPASTYQPCAWAIVQVGPSATSMLGGAEMSTMSSAQIGDSWAKYWLFLYWALSFGVARDHQDMQVVLRLKEGWSWWNDEEEMKKPVPARGNEWPKYKPSTTLLPPQHCDGATF